jgi:hypothetical protein
VLEVCRDFRLPQFKLTELNPSRELSPRAAIAGSGDGVPATPSNGRGTRPPNVVLRPPPGDAGVVAPEPLLPPRPTGLFGHFTKKKRFLFFG